MVDNADFDADMSRADFDIELATDFDAELDAPLEVETDYPDDFDFDTELDTDFDTELATDFDAELDTPLEVETDYPDDFDSDTELDTDFNTELETDFDTEVETDAVSEDTFIAKSLEDIGGKIEIQEPPDLSHLEPTTVDEPMGQSEFREIQKELTSAEKGNWGEVTLNHEMQETGHRVLMEHDGNPTKPGFDGVTYDEETGTIHLWEAKNNSASIDGRQGYVGGLSAFNDNRVGENTKEFLESIPEDDPDYENIRQAVADNNVVWNVRMGPDTQITDRVMEQHKDDKTTLANYTYDHMVKIHDDMMSADSTGDDVDD